MDQGEEVILEKKHVFLYNIPLQVIQKPKLLNWASNWDLSFPVQMCKLTLTATGPSCRIQLTDSDGNIFGQSVIDFYPAEAGHGQSSSLNTVNDSSRYFSLKVENSAGMYDLLGLGFASHEDSSDLTKTLESYFICRNQIGEETPVHPECKQMLEPQPKQMSSKYDKKTDWDLDWNELGSSNSFIMKAEKEYYRETVSDYLGTTCPVGQERKVLLHDHFVSRNENITPVYPIIKPEQMLVSEQTNCSTEANAHAVTNFCEMPTYSLSIATAQKHAVDCDLGTSCPTGSNFQSEKLHEHQPEAAEATEALSGDSSSPFEINTPKQKFNESNLVRYCKFEKMLSERCIISIEEAVKLNKNINKLIDSHRKKKLELINLCPSENNSCGGFRYRLSGNVFQCHLCPATIPRITNGSRVPLENHWTEVHEIKVNDIISCKRCAFVFSTETQYSLHYKLKHEFECFLCPFITKGCDTIHRHLLHAHMPTLLELVAKQKASETGDITDTFEIEAPACKETKLIQNQNNEENERNLRINVLKLIKTHRKIRLELFGVCPSPEEPCGGFRYCVPDKGLQCHLCPAFVPYINKSIVPLTKHWKEVHGINGLICKMCDLVFSTDAQFTLHKKLVHYFDCLLCSFLFGSIRGLQRHLIKEHREVLLESGVMQSLTETNKCPRMWNNQNTGNRDGNGDVEIIGDGAGAHTDEKRKVKKRLGENVSTFETLASNLIGVEPVYKMSKLNADEQDTVESHTSSSSPVLEQIGQNSVDSEVEAFLEQQRQRSRKNKSKRKASLPFQREIIACSGSYYRLPGNMLQCHICSANYPGNNDKSYTLLKDHWEKIHGIEFPKILNCVPCGIVFSNEDQVTQHKNLMHDFACIVCYNKFEFEGSLRRHLITQHGQTLSYSCYVCRKGFGTKLSLKVHEKSTH